MLSVQPVPFIFRRIMLKERRLPPFYCVTGLTFLIFKLPLVGIFMTVRSITGLIVKRFIPALYMTLLTVDIDMLPL